MIYAISDLHLGFAVEKPMDVFGSEWFDHASKIKANWESTVTGEDTVLIAGDISWATRLQEVLPDMAFIEGLPGKKILYPGNHDMWWSSVNKLKPMFETITFIKHGFILVEDMPICGSRGWFCPDYIDFDSHDEKIYKREIMRVEASLNEAMRAGHTDITLVMHFPPIGKNSTTSGFISLIKQYPITNVIYGHIHNQDDIKCTLQGVHDGVEYTLVSGIALDFNPIQIMAASLPQINVANKIEMGKKE